MAPGLVADAMLDAVVDVVGRMSVSSLQLVRIVIFQAPMLANFHKSMQERAGTGEPEEEGTSKPEKKGTMSMMMCMMSFYTFYA